MIAGRSQITVLSLCFLYGWLASCVSPAVSQKPATTLAGTHLGDLVESQPARPGAHQKDTKKPKERELTITQSVTEPKSVAQAKGPQFTLSAQDVEVKTILLALGKEIKQNITIEPSINQKATIDLKNVTLTEALDSLLKPLRLKYEINSNFIHVTQDKMQTRIFRLNYILSKRIGSSNVRASSGAGVSGSSSGGSSITGASSTTGGGAVGGVGGSAGASGQRTSSSIQSSEETDLWKEITAGLQQVIVGASIADDAGPTGATGGGAGAASAPGGTNLGAAMSAAMGGAGGGANSGGTGSTPGQTSGQPAGGQSQQKERGYVSVNRQAGIIIVKDYPDVILKVAEFLEAIEGSVQRQVFIQAKILEVVLNKNFTLGIDWSKVSPINVIRNKPVPGSGAPGTATTTTTATTSTANNTLVGAFGTMLQGTTLFGVSPNNSNLNVVIDALAQQGKVSVLSSPKIATLNNQRAVIKVGTEDVFFVPETSAVQGATTTNFLPRTITIGIVLDVLPQIDANGMVMMSINTSISEKSGDRISADGKISVPVLDVRESNNVVLSRSGQTIVIGGLMKNKISKKKNSVPMLGDIPLIGQVFQHEADIDEKTELVIMLTPEVMAGLAVDDQLKETQSDIKRIGYSTEPLPGSH